MKKDFRIYALEDYENFCNFINGLSKRGKKFTVTPHLRSKNKNGGFVVFFYS
jgi:hypothetical protein